MSYHIRSIASMKVRVNDGTACSTVIYKRKRNDCEDIQNKIKKKVVKDTHIKIFRLNEMVSVQYVYWKVHFIQFCVLRGYITS